MEMTNFSVDFVKRTLEIVNNVNENNCKYEVTLLLNCLLALIMLPCTETPTAEADFIADCVDQVRKMDVINYIKPGWNNDHKIFRALRNSIAHLHIFVENIGGKIYKIELRDTAKKKPNEYHIDDWGIAILFTVNQLKQLAIYIAQKHLERIEHIEDKG